MSTMQSAQTTVIDSEQLQTLAIAAGVEAAGAILDAFWTSCEDLLVLLKDSFRDRNFDEMSKAAHALKGSAMNLGAVQLAERAKLIETGARDNDLQTIQQAFIHLASDVAASRVAFKDLMQSLAA
ncbi:MAG: Hpt domain-containing protein [Aquisalinus sp.]|nr:Hpt domain-containing protein [Aquisalinus sp.]